MRDVQRAGAAGDERRLEVLDEWGSNDGGQFAELGDHLSRNSISKGYQIISPRTQDEWSGIISSSRRFIHMSRCDPASQGAPCGDFAEGRTIAPFSALLQHR